MTPPAIDVVKPVPWRMVIRSSPLGPPSHCQADTVKDQDAELAMMPLPPAVVKLVPWRTKPRSPP